MTKITRIGQCVSVEMPDSLQMVFIAHTKGRLTNKRYRYAKVLVDHFTDLKYVHCISEITSEETIYVNACFERHVAGLNVNGEHYHCGNGRFKEKTIVQHCKVMG